MIESKADWSATLTVRTSGRPDLARWIARSLRPEAARELSRAGAEVRDAGGSRLEVALRAADAGAMRAALNTYLGWIHLTVATAATASPAGASPPSRP